MEYQSIDSQIHRLIRLAVWAGTTLLIAYVAVLLGTFWFPPEYQEAAAQVQRSLEVIGVNLWGFVQVPLQLFIMLLIAQWFAERVGFRMDLQSFSTSFNIQAFIAVVVIGSYCIAVLVGIAGVDKLKEIALIVVGFYFGTRAKGQDDKLEKNT